MQDYEHRDLVEGDVSETAAPVEEPASSSSRLPADEVDKAESIGSEVADGVDAAEAMRVLDEIDAQFSQLRALQAQQAASLRAIAEATRVESSDESKTEDADPPAAARRAQRQPREEPAPPHRPAASDEGEREASAATEPAPDSVQSLLSQSAPSTGDTNGAKETSEKKNGPARGSDEPPVEISVESRSPAGTDKPESSAGDTSGGDQRHGGGGGDPGNGQSSALRGRMAALEAKVARLELELDATAAARNFARREVDVLEQRMERMTRQTKKQTGQIEQYREKLSEARDQIGKLISALEEHTPQLERGAAAVARVNEQEAELEQLREELDTTKAQAEQAQAEAEQARAEAESQAAAAPDPELEARLAQREEEVATLMGEVQSLREQVESLEKARQQAPTVDPQEMEQLRAKVQELRKSLTEARKAAKGVGPDATAHQAMAAQIEQQQRRIAMIARHLKTRRQRLRKARRLLRERRMTSRSAAAPAAPAPAHAPAPPPSRGRKMPEDMEKRAAQIRQLEQQRIQLAEMRQQLTQDEKKMMRRWARPKAAMTVGWLMILAIVSAGISWIATNHFFPHTIAAAVTLEARQQNRMPLSEDTARNWQEWHVSLINDPNFQASLAKRFAERKLESYATAAAVKARIDGDLSIDTAVGDELVMTLAGTNQEETAQFLELVASTVALESRRNVEKRPEAAWAIVPGGSVTGKGAASINPVPLKDHRLYVAGPMFGISYVVILALIIVIYRRLVKAKRVFDESDDLVLAGSGAFQQAA